MNLQKWLDKGEIQSVKVGSEDLKNLLDLVDRDLKDAQVEAISVDRRFASAYGAALNLANFIIRNKGYRVIGQRGHHRTTFLVAAEILGKQSIKYLDYFDICRRKRNKVDYDFVDVVSKDEVDELIQAVLDFKKIVIK